MTKKLKISIRETRYFEIQLSTQFAAEIMYHEYIKHDSNIFKTIREFDIKTLECRGEKWYIKQISKKIRPATDAEIKAWHRLQIGKFLGNELYRDKDDVNTLKDKEIILELIDECPSTITQTPPKTDDDKDDGDQIYVSIDMDGNAWCGV